MLTISTKGVYGTASLLELALSYGKGSVRIDEIAKRQKIPADYLRQLLIVLKKSNLVESARGTQGGYLLAKPPAKITVREILESLEGPIKLVSAKVQNKALSSYWNGRQDEIEKLFNATLEDLVDEKQRLEENIVYHI